MHGTGRKGGSFGRTDGIIHITVGAVELDVGRRIADIIDGIYLIQTKDRMRCIDVGQFVYDDGELAFRGVAVTAVDGRGLGIIHRGAIGIPVGEWFLIGEK